VEWDGEAVERMVADMLADDRLRREQDLTARGYVAGWIAGHRAGMERGRGDPVPEPEARREP
jgi:hypothetical protein